MNDKINQKNVFGHNLINSSIKKIITKHRTQGFIAGVVSTVIADIILHLIITNFL